MTAQSEKKGIAARDPDRAGKRLGRGLAALIGDLDGAGGPGDTVRRRPQPPSAERMVAVGAIRRNPANPRRTFDPTDLDELASSLRSHGFLSPIVVRPASDEGAFEIVAGERRWRAAQRAELRSVPVIVRDVDDRLALELAIVENVQRADLNAIDEARGYEQLMERGYTQVELSDIIGKSRSHVANTLRLMKLPDAVRRLVGEGALSAGHARALLAAEDPEALAKRVIEEELTVRQTEKLAKVMGSGEGDGEGTAGVKSGGASVKDPDTSALEQRLTDLLRARVLIDHRRKGGQLTIRFGSREEFDAIVQRLETTGSPPNFD